jgi:hypothetical protein
MITISFAFEPWVSLMSKVFAFFGSVSCSAASFVLAQYVKTIYRTFFCATHSHDAEQVSGEEAGKSFRFRPFMAHFSCLALLKNFFLSLGRLRKFLRFRTFSSL